MDPIRFRLRIFLGVFLAVVLLGTLGFAVVENLRLSDAFYFTIVTVGTVGYGDIHPTTQMGKVLAILVIVMGVGTFLGVIANATEIMLNRRERLARLEKLNMVIGAFFSEVGTKLLKVLAKSDPNLDKDCEDFIVTSSWAELDFVRVRNRLKEHDYKVEIDKINLEAMHEFLLNRREFMVRLLENPTLSEHESFSALLWAVFHLAEELSYRDDFAALPGSDLAHLASDMKRAYALLGVQWLEYMKHLKENYPYLFSLAMRTNPFDKDASPIVES